MADEKQPTSGVGVRTTEVETSMGAEHGMSMTLDPSGTLQTSTENTGKQSIDVGTKTAAGDQDAGDEDLDRSGGDEGEGDSGEGEGTDEGSGDETSSELPDWNKDDADTVAAYDKRYTKDDGNAINLDALSQTWWASVKDGDLDKGTLGENTYKYLNDKWGLSEDQVKQIEAGQVAQRKIERAGRINAAGGDNPAENLKAAIAWGAGGGYTEDQRKAFNAAFHGPDQQRAIEAVELLMARYERANKSSTTPKRNSTQGGGNGGTLKAGGDVFHNRAEYDAAVKEAGKDPLKRQAIMDKVKRSPGANNWL